MQRKLILMELNEVPFRIIDDHCQRYPGSSLARLISKCAQFTSFTEDSIALDPWISWPTLHRGVPDSTHGILHLGQADDEIDAQYPPIWRMLRSHGLSVGVFGSLHSSNAPADATKYSFYLPDYFDSRVFAHPTSLEPFQALNLLLTRQSARNVSRSLPIGGLVRTLPKLRAKTIFDAAGHLLRESLNPSLRIRRRAYQPLVMADLFMGQLESTQPDFATFYTNHVAAAMHRYWGAAFPGDYETPMEPPWVAKYADEISFSMLKFDAILEPLVSFVDRHPEYSLMIASSMGQAGKKARKTDAFLTIMNLAKFMESMGVPSNAWEAMPAMVPCQCVRVQESYRDRFVESLNQLTVGGVAALASKRQWGALSYDEREHGFFQIHMQFDNYAGDVDARRGFGMMAHEDGVNCTAQHVPDGSLLLYQNGASADASRSRISTLEIAPWILEYFGLPAPAYMRQALSLAA